MVNTLDGISKEDRISEDGPSGTDSFNVDKDDGMKIKGMN